MTDTDKAGDNSAPPSNPPTTRGRGGARGRATTRGSSASARGASSANASGSSLQTPAASPPGKLHGLKSHAGSVNAAETVVVKKEEGAGEAAPKAKPRVNSKHCPLTRLQQRSDQALFFIIYVVRTSPESQGCRTGTCTGIRTFFK